MKKLNSMFLSIIVILTVALFVSCSDKKDNNNPLVPGTNAQITMTFNGDGFSNTAVSLNNGMSSYSVGENYTAVLFSGKAGNDSVYFYVLFAGNQATSKNWDDDNGVIMYRSTSTGNKSYMGISNGSLSITSYEAVGSKVSGTLQGQIVDVSDTTKTINITNGNFSSTRIADIP
jgi:hypothetical protein